VSPFFFTCRFYPPSVSIRHVRFVSSSSADQMRSSQPLIHPYARPFRFVYVSRPTIWLRLNVYYLTHPSRFVSFMSQEASRLYLHSVRFCFMAELWRTNAFHGMVKNEHFWFRFCLSIRFVYVSRARNAFRLCLTGGW